ncbi:MAG: Cytosine-specific methyltransferase [Candidatus Gallionella acididurans]|uniref:Cytosine-specific methyltransferase n=1 Tax=Candidatus Gallionella acididurans TaxID=1796491 RepID=A0A139BUU6_9PROT|nr:MAG: Cytosine-specific methyltransferase [Candidatus Gallionella acididurans]
MNTALTLVSDQDAALVYLTEARKHHTQAAIAKHLGVGIRTISRWEARQTNPPAYLAHALQQLLPFGEESPAGAFDFIDLFAGIGGLRKAFEQVGGRCVYTSEWDSYAQKTYAENFRDRHPIAGDITQVDAADIPDHDVLLAGFPCQPFSIAGVSKKNALGKKHGFACETQGTLFFDVARIIEAKRPRAFLLENVKNLVSHDKGRTFDVIRRTLTHDLGYHIHYRVIDGAHFVPQHRERILIVGFREPVAFDFDALPLPPKGTHTLKDILHRTDGSEPELPWDEGRFFDHKKKKVQDKYTLTDNLWLYLQNYAEKHRLKGNGFGFGLVKPTDVTRTLSARYYKDGSEILVYQGTRKNPRRLTPRECARLMGYPDTFRIPVSDTRAYQLFSQAAVVPMVKYAAKLMVSQLNLGEKAPEAVEVPKDIMATTRWTKEQLKLAFHLYCQLPFGKLHSRNPEIIKLAKLIGRTPGAVAMKLVNFASLDPAITSTGRTGLGNAGSLDREVWAEFHADWEKLAVECEMLRRNLDRAAQPEDEADELLVPEDYTGETRRVITEQRIKQNFFRRAVLSSYQGRCCMSGLSEPRLLVASHIVPWSKDKANRLNPSNGLCLSAIHDRAFDKGLITLTDDFKIVVSTELKRKKEPFVMEVLLPLDGRTIQPPERFAPQAEFIAWHRKELFVDNRK